MHEYLEKCIGKYLLSVRQLIFDGRGDRKYAFVSNIELNFDDYAVVLFDDGYGEQGTIHLLLTTLEKEKEQYLDSVKDLVIIEDVSSTEAWKSILYKCVNNVSSQAESDSFKNIIIEFEKACRVTIVSSGKGLKSHSEINYEKS